MNLLPGMQVRNKKHHTVYTIINSCVVNATNSANGQKMVLYTNGRETFAREINEFQEKFYA